MFVFFSFHDYLFSTCWTITIRIVVALGYLVIYHRTYTPSRTITMIAATVTTSQIFGAMRITKKMHQPAQLLRGVKLSKSGWHWMTTRSIQRYDMDMNIKYTCIYIEFLMHLPVIIFFLSYFFLSLLLSIRSGGHNLMCDLWTYIFI